MSNRTYGIEIEVAGISEEQAYLVLRVAGINIADPGIYNSRPDFSKWSLHSDGSIEDHESDGSSRTCEIVSPVLTGPNGLKQIRKVINVLKKYGAYVNETCGLHVHVGAQDLLPDDVVTICRRYSEHESTINKFVLSDRVDNTYCKPISDIINSIDLDMRREYHTQRRNEISAAIANGTPASCFAYEMSNIDREFNRAQWTSINEIAGRIDDRYYTVNLQSFSKYKTIEFRQHHGTLNHTEITNWIQFILNFVETSRGIAAHKANTIVETNSNRTIRQHGRRLVYEALLAAGDIGMTKEQIIDVTRSCQPVWSLVQSNIDRMKTENGLNIEKFASNGVTRWRLVQPPVRTAQPIANDKGLFTNCPRHIRKHFMARIINPATIGIRSERMT
jgi:hypothetical protein